MKIDFDMNKILGKHIPKDTQPIEKMMQLMLDDGNEFLPRDQDELLSSGSTEAISPTEGRAGWYSVKAQFLHEGKVMVGVKSGSAWAKSNEKKIATEADLVYSKDKNPNAQAKWTEVAKAKNLEKWKDQWLKLTGVKE